MGPEELVEHLRDYRGVDSVIAGDGDLTEVVESMLAAGWTYSGTEYVAGKRVRYLLAPDDQGPSSDTA
jgi:hypothetical protein